MVVELLARLVIFIVRPGSKRHRPPQSSCRTVATQILRAVLFPRETRIQERKIPWYPHLLVLIPSQRTMPNVIRRREAANTRATVAREATRMATIEHRDE